jgi:hypothetical protein
MAILTGIVTFDRKMATVSDTLDPPTKKSNNKYIQLKDWGKDKELCDVFGF